MNIGRWLRVPRTRRALAACLVSLAAGGLVLYRAPASAHGKTVAASPSDSGSGSTFQSAHARASIALTQTRLLSGGEARVSAVLRVSADASAKDKVRAPLALAIVLDTSGSMQGVKMDNAKNAVVDLLRELRDDDQIALVQYSSDASLLQPLAFVGEVRERLEQRVKELQADGGTNIPLGLGRGVNSLASTLPSRVRRVVLVSDGLDSGRLESERLARSALEERMTVSSLGIGLDFDASYMGGIAEAGRGNFAFVETPGALRSFLRREVQESVMTTIESAEARLELPQGMRFVRAIGAEARTSEDGREVTLHLGALFAGDERRVVVELATSLEAGESQLIKGELGWSEVDGGHTRVLLSPLTLVGTADAREASSSVDGSALAEATSALASARQLEAAEALERGEMAAATAIVDANMQALRAAAAVAPSPAATALVAQTKAYEETKAKINAAPPKSDAAKAAARSMADKEFSNLGRNASY